MVVRRSVQAGWVPRKQPPICNHFTCMRLACRSGHSGHRKWGQKAQLRGSDWGASPSARHGSVIPLWYPLCWHRLHLSSLRWP